MKILETMELEDDDFDFGEFFLLQLHQPKHVSIHSKFSPLFSLRFVFLLSLSSSTFFYSQPTAQETAEMQLELLYPAGYISKLQIHPAG